MARGESPRPVVIDAVAKDIVEVENPKLTKTYTEQVKNDDGGLYNLVIPLFLTFGNRIFMWDRKGNRYVEVTYEKFVDEMHVVELS